MQVCSWRNWKLNFLQDSDDEERRNREKQERVQESMRKREEEVKQSLSSSLRERDKEREQHKKDEAIQLFNALLADLVSYFVIRDVNIVRNLSLQCLQFYCPNIHWVSRYEPHHEKTCLRGFRPGNTETGLLSYRD